MHDNPMKFENPVRVQELDIINSLRKAGIASEDTICDYGCGTGLFAAEAAKLTDQTVYALDIDTKMLQLVNQKKEAQKLDNISTILVHKDAIPLEDKSIDLWIMVTVFHEIESVPEFIQEVKRVLKPKGRVLVIEFHKRETPMGPPVDQRMSPYQGARHFFRHDINLVEQFELGDNFYMLLLENGY